MLSEKAISEYKQIYEQTYGTEISYEEAEIQASRFLKLIHTVLAGKNDRFSEFETYAKKNTIIGG